MTADITLTDAITALVSEKRAVGYKYDAEQQVLARFEAFCRCEFPGEDTLTEASVQAWIATANGGACHDNCVSHGWTKIGRCDQRGREGTTLRESGHQYRGS